VIFVVNLRNFRFLDRYIPGTLFIETNLPSIKIYEPKVPDKSLKDKGRAVVEDVALALAVYLPGKPSFRHWADQGMLLPISSKIGKQHYANVGENYEFDIVLIDEDTLRSNLPEEYEYFLTKYSPTLSIPQTYRLLSLTPYAFYRKSRECKGLYWIVLHSTHSTVPLSNLQKYLKLKFREQNEVLLRFLRKESISYGRFSSVPFNFNPVLDGLSSTINKLLKEVFGLQYNPLEHGTLNVFRYIYAFDYNMCFYFLSVQDKECLKYLLNNSCVCEDDIEKRYTCAKILSMRQNYRGVKVFSFNDTETVSPLVYGYVVEKTKYLKLEMEYLINLFLDDLFEKLNEVKDITSLSFDEFYRIVSTNHALVNVLKHVIANDLSLSMMFSNCYGFSSLLDSALTYNDLYSFEKIVDIINENERLAEEIVAILKMYNEQLYLDPKAYIIGLILHGERIERCKEIHGDKLKERINTIFSDEESKRKIIYSTIVHTLNHHLISLISSISGISSEYLSEIYDLNPKMHPQIFIYENMSGGIEAIETALDLWSKSQEEMIEGFLLKLGECLIGTPEDLLYFVHKKYGPVNIDKNKVLTIIKELGIIITPEELEETRRLYNVFIEEAKLLSSVFRDYKDECSYEDIVKEIVDARYSVESSFKRFVEPSEILIYIFKNLEKYPCIKALLVSTARRFLEAKKDIRDKLTIYYSITNARLLAEKIIDELHLILADVGEASKLRLINILKSKETRILIEMFRVFDSTLRKLYLKSCNNVCGLCYLNSKFCGRYGAPWIQEKTLNRRLLKIFGSWLLRNSNLLRESLRDIDLGKIIGKTIIGNNIMYIKIP